MDTQDVVHPSVGPVPLPVILSQFPLGRGDIDHIDPGSFAGHSMVPLWFRSVAHIVVEHVDLLVFLVGLRFHQVPQ